MDIFKSKTVVFFGFLGLVFLLFGLYMAVAGQVPAIGSDDPLITLEGIDRLMGIYPFALGLFFTYKAKMQHEDNADIA